MQVSSLPDFQPISATELAAWAKPFCMAQTLSRVLSELLGCKEFHNQGDPGTSVLPGHVSSTVSSVLLVGPPGCGKSGLLFSAALVAAEEGAGPVIFISRESLQRLPGGGREAREPLLLKRIRFLYPSSLRELLHLVSSMHLSFPAPSLIVVDGLERYLAPTCGSADGALISGLLLDSAAHFKCGLLISAAQPLEMGGDGAFLAVERYFPAQCHIYGEVTTEQEEGTFHISFPSHFPPCVLHTAKDGTLKISLPKASFS
ncbi:hypothetical protein XENTR_v10010072 [Xenopus tropicalis]|uniref:ATPase SWSAP1 n=1 Tax=Xenopus tropicalis TaxID=8364 RepID=F6QTY1_XENTR|nr:ATPase SWSAP1 [Xenopus tropicalis]KAE8620023.1 hypothetical protein XENTR_v10010072 [Xenopus tropicalis]|eukprot:XP_002939162.1 PREDICTED: ATPase SWSAP1 [Xenopus tropicalis]